MDVVIRSTASTCAPVGLPKVMARPWAAGATPLLGCTGILWVPVGASLMDIVRLLSIGNRSIGLRYAQGLPDAADKARNLTALTLKHLRAGEPRLVLVGGLPGTGKSTVAAGLADACHAVLLRSDRIRKEAAGRDPRSPAAAGWQHGLYSRERTWHTYALLLRRAGELLANGETVILDASWQDETERAAARKLVTESASTLVELRCDAPEGVAAQRIRQRTGDPSDATGEVAARMARSFAPWPRARIIDTTAPVTDTIRCARQLVEGGRPCMS